MADTTDDSLIEQIATAPNVARICHHMDDKDISIFIPALRAMGNILTTNDPRIIERCLWEGVLDKLTNYLFQSNSNIIKEACWAISNITAGPSHHVEKFIDSGAFDRIIALLSATNIDHRKEALWVLANAITGADFPIRKMIYEKGKD